MENTKNNSYMKLIPVMLCFFAMGFVDLVGIASNYVKADLGLTDSQANIFPSLVFFWFLTFLLQFFQKIPKILPHLKQDLVGGLVTYKITVRCHRQIHKLLHFI